VTAPGEVRYARASGGIDIAYTVFGEGSIDFVVALGFVTHLDMEWDFPWLRPFRALGRVGRVIVFDKRGTGLSDRSLGFGSLEERSDDIRAVMDAAGSERAVIHGSSESGPMAIFFAAQYPERVDALMLYGTAARFLSAPDYPEGLSPDAAHDIMEMLVRDWGSGRAYGFLARNAKDPSHAERSLAPFERAACTPQMVRQIMERNFEMDVRPILGAISVPTIVVHCSGDPVVPSATGRYLSERIPGARYVEIDGDFHLSWLIEDITKLSPPPVLEFLAGLGIEEPRPPTNRVLATVLFTDIVGSTETVSGVGDRAWHETLDRHDILTDEHVKEQGGRIVKTTGDGVLATFASPSAAIQAARAICQRVVPLGIELRAGVHTGEIELRTDDVGGLGVHIGQRVCALADAGEVLVSSTVRDLVTGSGIEFSARGEHELKGVPGSWKLFAVRGN
jgi:class 3 adenylate cyclase/pimeloyl-ACP methyl ester carboxylesterase